MSERIKIFDKNFKALGSTSKAFDIEKTEELMREYTLSFSIVNNDAVFKYISENNVFLYNGQYFDIAGIDGDSGSNNITQVAAEHISYRLADYTLPNGYSFVGTVREIAVDILNEAKTVDKEPASDNFSIGETADLGTLSFSLSGAKNVTAREALIAMSKLGVEIAFDNFTVNIPERRGANSGITFTYGVNLTGVHRTWQRGNGWSYDIDIADLQKTAGGEAYKFVLGDDIVVNDTLSNIEINSRIISYTECDDPTKNHVTVGVFVRDNASLTIETDRIANTANDTANNSVQQGEKYSNVSITHKDGFMAINKAGNQRVMMNGDDCFIVQVKQNGSWVTVNSLEAFGLLIDRFTSAEAKDKFYVKVGKNLDGQYGLDFYINGINSFQMGMLSSGYFCLSTESLLRLRATNGVVSVTGDSVQFNAGGINVSKNGTAYSTYNGDVKYTKSDGTTGTMSIINGFIVSV